MLGRFEPQPTPARIEALCSVRGGRPRFLVSDAILCPLHAPPSNGTRPDQRRGSSPVAGGQSCRLGVFRETVSLYEIAGALIIIGGVARVITPTYRPYE